MSPKEVEPNIGFYKSIGKGSLQSMSGIAMNKTVEAVCNPVFDAAQLCIYVSTMLVHRGDYAFFLVVHLSYKVG